MSRIQWIIWAVPLMLVACASLTKKDTIGRLRHEHVEVKEVKIEGGLEKAMQSYQRFLQDSPGSAMAPEAIRRLADLKIEKEYGTLTPGAVSSNPNPATPGPDRETPPKVPPVAGPPSNQVMTPPPAEGESEADFEKRTTGTPPAESAIVSAPTRIWVWEPTR